MFTTHQFSDHFLLATSEKSQTYAIKCRNGTYLKLSASALILLKAVESGMTFAQIADKVGKRQGSQVSAQGIEKAYHKIQKQLEVVDEPRSKMSIGFWLKINLFPKAFVNKITRPLTVAFRPIGAVILIGLVLAAIFLFFAEPDVWHIYPSLASFGLLIVAMFFHELGHSTALRSFGAEPDEIGFAAYWIVPVFFSNVTAAWRLPRWQRIVISLGGVYFHLVICAGYILIYLLTGLEAFHSATVWLLLSAGFTLLPVFKMDGYWVISDLLGVTNLAQQRTAVAKHIWSRVRGKAFAPMPWPTHVAILVMLYSVTSVAVAAYFLIQGILLRWPHVIAYPALVYDFVGSLLSIPNTLSLAEVEMLITETYVVFAIFLAALWLSRASLQLFQRAMQQKLSLFRVQ